MIKQIVQWAEERGITKQQPDANSFVKNIVSELGEFIDDDKEYREVDAICDIMVFCITELPKYGIDPELALAETYKEINSRTGEWNHDVGKWLKFKTPEAIALWQEADYGKCFYKDADDELKAEQEELRHDLLNEGYGVL